MIAESYLKQPDEIETIKVDWSQRLSMLGVSGYAISAVTVAIYDENGSDVSNSMLEGNPTYSGTDTIMTFKDGVDGKDYYAKILVTLAKTGYTTLTQEEDLTIKVREIGKK